jgi:DNA-binding NtrC family response regulator
MDKILVVDDEESVRYSFQRAFGKDYRIITAETGEEALREIEKSPPALVFLDVRMPKQSGMEVLKAIKELYPRLPMIMMTAYSDVNTAIQAMKLGAFEYVTKPFENVEVRQLIQKALESSQTINDSVPFQQGTNGGCDGNGACNGNGSQNEIVGSSRVMHEIYKTIGRVAEYDTTVLIQGESGTGKELIARAIHDHSRRRENPFVAVNCAAIPETLLESELLGYDKGAFSGADSRKVGKFELSNKGTIFLDEIADMPLMTQAKILRVLQDQTFERLGGTETIKVDVRVLAATNQNLEQAVNEKRFRGDLLYRLNAITLFLPPLRERPEDVPELVEYFITRLKQEIPSPVQGISSEALNLLKSYSWPGNVRELENVLKKAVILCKSQVLTKEEFPFLKKAESPLPDLEKFEIELGHLLEVPFKLHQGFRNRLFPKIMGLVERHLVQKALRETGNNQVRSAEILGINRITLRKRIREFGLE